MQEIISDLQNGTISISDKFNINSGTSSVDATPYFTTIGSEYTISFINLENVTEFSKFSYDTTGLTLNRYLSTYYRISRDGLAWTEWMNLNVNVDNFPTIDPKDPLYLDVKWIRTGTSTTDSIRLLEYSLEGVLTRQVSRGDSTVLIESGQTIIFSAPFIYKVFKIKDYEVISSTGISNVELKYRFSQDNSRSWSNWEPLSKENITTVRINPIRFFQIEYSITNNSTDVKTIQDINLIGDFQNVSLDYYKTNLFGIRECCQSNLLGKYDSNGNFVPASNGIAGGAEPETLSELSTEDKANLFNPYQQNASVNLLTKLSTDAEQIFGHTVIYFLTDPDKKGIDYTFHEYQLYNTVCNNEIKVSVDQNQFPDSQVVMNQFDLGLFEAMTINITKKQFKELFGPNRRPSKEDFLYFCNINRMFIVDHSQQFRNFNNAAVYYKIILKKYTQKANVQSGNSTISDTLKKLTQNSTMDELMGVEKTQDKASIANKDQFKELTRDPIRLEFGAEIIKELIENSSTIISKSHYDLSTVDYNTTAILYKNLKPKIRVSDNIGFQIWFKINNYITDESYNFIDHYDVTNSFGFKCNIVNDVISVKLNSDTYTFDVILDEEVWYCYVLNVDQRNRKMQQFIYKRDVDDEDDASKLQSTILRKEFYNEQDITPIDYELYDVDCRILASDMKITNIRLFIEVIPEEVHNKILNQYIIRDDSKYMVFADNANVKLTLPRFPLFE